MAAASKERFSVTLNNEDYTALKLIADSQKPPLSLQYIVSYALTDFIAAHKSRQIELDFGRRAS